MTSLARLLVARLVEGRLPAFVAARVRARVFSDAAWAAHYHELRVAERALAGGASLSAGQMSSLLEHVLTSPVLSGGHPQTPVLPTTPSAAPVRARSSRVQLFAVAGALACAAIFVVVGRAPSASDRAGQDELHARGNGAAKAGVHVRCVDAARAHVLSESDVKDGAHLTCVTGGLLAFSGTNTTGATLYVSGVAVDDLADNASMFELPLAGDGPVAIPAGGVDVPLKNGFPLDQQPRRIHVSARLVSAADAPKTAGSPELIVDVMHPPTHKAP